MVVASKALWDIENKKTIGKRALERRGHWEEQGRQSRLSKVLEEDLNIPRSVVKGSGIDATNVRSTDPRARQMIYTLYGYDNSTPEKAAQNFLNYLSSDKGQQDFPRRYYGR